MLKEFRDFALKGNALDMAVGIIIGAAFGTIVQSLVNDIIMPPIGLVVGHVDFSDLFLTLKNGATPGPYVSVAAAKNAGAVTINYGVFINSIISFTIVAFSVFLVVSNFNKMRDKFFAAKEEAPKEATTKECPECFTEIPLKAKKCPHCTSLIG